MIDVRLLRTDLDAHAGGDGPARTSRSCSTSSTPRPSSTPGSREITAERDDIRARVNELSKRGRPAAPRRRRRGRRSAQAPRAAPLGDRRAPARRRARRDRRRPARASCWASPTCPTPTPPTARPTPTTRSCTARSACPTPFADHQPVPHWETGGRPRHPRQRAGDQDQRGDVHDDPRPRRHDGPGPVPARPRPQRRRLRGDPPAVARHDRHAHRHRASCRSSPTTPSPSSATTCGASPPPRCR